MQTMLQKWLVILLLLLFTKNSLGQCANDKNRLYEFLVECPIYKCNIIGKIIDTTLLIAPPKSKFMLVDMKQDQCIIRFTVLNKNKSYRGKSISMEDYTTYSYYSITKAQLDFKSTTVKKSDIDLVVGTVITPIKLRYNPFDFSKDIAIGTTFGVKYTLNQDKQAAIDGLIGVGISSVSLDSFTTHGMTLKNVDLMAFTSSVGVVLELGNAQVGLFVGFDFISNENHIRYNWIYQAKPWVSFGIGFSMFSFNLKKN